MHGAPLSRPLAELSPMERRRNSPSYNQISKVSIFNINIEVSALQWAYLTESAFQWRLITIRFISIRTYFAAPILAKSRSSISYAVQHGKP